MNVFFQRVLNSLRNVRESGMTMIEVVVALALLGIITTFTTATILNTTQTSDNFNRGVENESNLLDAVSLISRDVALAESFQYAGADALSMTTTDSGTKSQVFYFVYNGTKGSIPTPAEFKKVQDNSSKLPSEAGIIEYRIVNGNNANPIIRNVVPGYNPGVNAQSAMFTYYNTSDEEVLMEANNPVRVETANLPSIRRVEMHFTSYIQNRSNPMEMHTSATPRLMGLTTKDERNSMPLADTDNKLPKPSLNGSLTPRTNTANLWWGSVAGADNYTVYMRPDGGVGGWNTVQQVEQKSGVINVTVPKLDWGHDYLFKVVAFDHRGPSEDSDQLLMRVTPEATRFINIDPHRGKDGKSINNYTVARDLNNSLAWSPISGPNTRYHVRTSKNGESWKTLWKHGVNTTNIQPGYDFGDVTRYTVAAYNETLTHTNPDGSVHTTGGEAVTSSEVTLISPPAMPEFNVIARNDITSVKSPDRTPQNVLSLTNTSELNTSMKVTYRSSNTKNSIATANVSTSKTKGAAGWSQWADDLSKQTNHKTNHGWGTRTWYWATAENNAGLSPHAWGSPVDQHPGPFKILDISNPTPFANAIVQNEEKGAVVVTRNVGSMKASWNNSLGSSGFDLKRSLHNSYGAAVIPDGKSIGGTKIYPFSDKLGMKNNVFAAELKGVSPGVVYKITMTSKAAAAGNNLVRNVDSTVLTRPDTPRSGIQELLCVEGRSQTYGSYIKSDTRPLYGKANQVTIRSHQERRTGSSYPVMVTHATRTEDLKTNTTHFIRLLEDTRYPASGTNPTYVGSFQLNLNIGTDVIPNSAADHGTSASERTGATLLRDSGYENNIISCAGQDPTGLDTSYDQVGSNGKFKTYNGSEWTVSNFSCYGVVGGKNYYGYYSKKSNPGYKGYTYAEAKAGGLGNFTKWTNSYCGWRIAPGGAEPYWQAG